jgi:hypothetical protein
VTSSAIWLNRIWCDLVLAPGRDIGQKESPTDR